ncbi:unnamed protein product [Linum trigynum]|uniref:Helitron helicase-like domain-containing protein n=1 Tax=Linum trigynum TaxID=586398 RepID=A0AAV2FA47_9ROSI
MLDENNELVRTFRRIRQDLQISSTPNLRLRIFGIKSRNRQYDLPTSSDIAALIPGDFVADREDRDIIVDHRGKGLKGITSLNPKFEALHFPLLFPYGEYGFHPQISYNASFCPASMRRKFVTQKEYYAFRLQYRLNEGHTLVQSGKALQHYCVDAFSTIELNRLAFLRTHQKDLRAEVYQGLQDAFAKGDMDGEKLGRIIMPSSYTGGPRYMQQLYHDAMATCQHYGNPYLFVTFTCNALWEEIVDAFADMVGPNSELKPMVVCRVFHMKLAILIDQFKRESYFGKTIAKIPDPNLDPEGYAAVVKFMIHGPCGVNNPTSPCMKDGKCSKYFPKEFCSETLFDKFGNVVYRRRNSGIQVQKGKAMLDNRYVVPYNRNLLVRAEAHINVEICHKGGLVKYLFKYITKGPDRSLIVAEDSTSSVQVPSNITKKTKDEIQEFIDCRSLSSYEAIWRINEYSIHHREPNVVRLGVHMDGQQNVSYKRRSNIQNV